MVDPISDRRPPITPQLALRVAIFGGIALVLFAVIFFRLWYLQVLSGDEYLAEANNNRVRELQVQAPRGEIVDRNGRVLVTNRRAIVVELDPAKLPESERDMAATWGQQMGQRASRPKGRRGEPVPIPPIADPGLERRYERLAKVLGTSANAIHRTVIRQLAQVPYADVRVKTDVPRSMLNYISERKAEFPGVRVEQVYLRRYPQKELAAQLVGTVGEISPQQLRRKRYRELKQGTVIGQDGLELQYDNYLRGTDGMRRIQVDAMGRPKGSLREVAPTAGRTVQRALASVGRGLPGAAVALDPRTGEVLAMASAPSFDPAVFTRPLTQRAYERLTSMDTGAPLFNRAIGAAYPTGSTFKPITGLAALQSGTIGADTVVNDGGVFELGPTKLYNAGEAVHGAVDMRRAMEVSSNVYFYRLGAQLNGLRGQVLQTWAQRMGFGRRTGIDLPAEFKGLVPDREWRAGQAEEERKCRRKRNISMTTNVFAAAAQGCGISDMRGWDAGDNVQLSVGQGDLQATPLQLATAYAFIENGGRRVTPRLGLEVQDSRGRTFQRIESPGSRRFSVDWPHERYPVYGKTGTAVRTLRDGKFDQSWYATYVPDPERPIVVVVTVEKGGYGADTAAPIARLMLARWFGQDLKVVRGSNRSR
jgi:penicillin-binding protein 2